MHGDTSKQATAEPALVACYVPARSNRGIIFGPWHRGNWVPIVHCDL